MLVASALTAAIAGLACGADPNPAPKKSAPNGPLGFGNGDGTYNDFGDAIVNEGAPSDAPTLFKNASGEAAGAATAPCLIEPEPGTLFPKNWLPPRFTWISASTNANLFELHVTAKNQTKDLIVYTRASSWTMPKEMWDAIREHSADVEMTVEVRAATYDGASSSGGGTLSNVSATNGGSLGIAPVEAPGSIVFWSIAGENESLLKGFTVGEPGVVDVLRKESVPTGQGGKKRTCIGCHTSTPDGKDVAVAWENGDESPTGVDVVRIEKGSAPGPRAAYVTPAASATFESGAPMFSTFTRAHWAPGDRLMLTNNDANLVWIDLEAKAPNAASGVFGKDGDPNPRRMGPAWSRDGSTIVYMSGTLGPNPFDLKGPSDLYVMPFANKAGATPQAPSKPLPGASDPNRAEYYPALSPDDAFVAFNALPDNGSLYDNPNAEIFLVSRTKSNNENIRLSANDPPSCQPKKKSPGITNSWPKWAPEVQESNGRKFYFLVFSSRRHLQTERPQLYVSPIQVDANGDVKTFPALYFRNQESVPNWEQWGNHTPAWDVFAIESAPVK